jgi:hypothetical protein
MNRDKTIRTAAIDAEMDAVLASEEPLIPSSGFLASVMESVRQEAAAPPPIPFPWKRALPGILLAAGVFGWGGFELVHLGLPALGPAAPTSVALYLPQLPAAYLTSAEQAGWVALALGASLLCWLFSHRIAGCGGLL